MTDRFPCGCPPRPTDRSPGAGKKPRSVRSLATDAGKRNTEIARLSGAARRPLSAHGRSPARMATVRSRRARVSPWAVLDCSEQRRAGVLRELQRLLLKPCACSGVDFAPQWIEVILGVAAR